MRLVNGHGVAAADPGSPVVRTGAAVDPLIIRLAAVLSGAHRTAMEMISTAWRHLTRSGARQLRPPARGIGGLRWKRHGNDRVKPDEKLARVESR
jgi:hypothetical protein